METVTLLYWYGFNEVDGKKVEGVHAECPKCGLRLFAPGTSPVDVNTCVGLFAKECPSADANRYTTEAMPFLIPAE